MFIFYTPNSSIIEVKLETDTLVNIFQKGWDNSSLLFFLSLHQNILLKITGMYENDTLDHVKLMNKFLMYFWKVSAARQFLPGRIIISQCGTAWPAIVYIHKTDIGYTTKSLTLVMRINIQCRIHRITAISLKKRKHWAVLNQSSTQQIWCYQRLFRYK